MSKKNNNEMTKYSNNKFNISRINLRSFTNKYEDISFFKNHRQNLTTHIKKLKNDKSLYRTS